MKEVRLMKCKVDDKRRANTLAIAKRFQTRDVDQPVIPVVAVVVAP
jgi:hypothetical protein